LLVRLTSLEGGDPPYDHNFLLGSAVYNILREYPELSSAIHASPRRTPYVLSEVFRCRGKKDEYWFRFGTSSQKLIEIMTRAIPKGTRLRIGESTFAVTGTSVANVPCLPGEYLTLSPILLKDKATGKSIVCDCPEYRSRLHEAVRKQVQNNMKREPEIEVRHFEPLDVRKRTIRGRIVLAQKGRLLIDGPPEEIAFLVNHGVGLSPGLAFGMIVPTEVREPDI
jgi:CRISPR-associated endoribonuclease Cas6